MWHGRQCQSAVCLCIVHEFQHGKLWALMDLGEEAWSPVIQLVRVVVVALGRKRTRPALAAIHPAQDMLPL
jgi:hypothetical protein